MTNLKGLATGIGSLPHQDADSALDLVFKYLPDIPFWPQLPKRDLREGMVAQFSENMPCLRLNPSGVFFDPQAKEEELERFYERVIAEDLDYFRISRDYALGLYKFRERLASLDLAAVKFLKFQVTGPFTFAAAVNNEAGIPLLHDKVLMQAVVKLLRMKALWQADMFKGFAKETILFIDEPYLGCFGSAYTPINKKDAIDGLTEFTDGLKPSCSMLGVHCCGNTDWSIFTEAGNIDIISFDAFDFQDKFALYAQDIQGFLKKGGVICWGIVPTREFTAKEDVGLLIRKIRQGLGLLVKKGVDEGLLKERLIISPACGLGTFTPQKAEEIFRLLSETSDFIRKNF